MIRIQKIRIHEFRGIRDLTLELKGANFAACGPNGTGKSGIVDSIEFALTGSISRLSGRGTKGLSVKQHGPHVDSRNKPDQAFVTMEVSIPSLGKTATIHRTVKDAGTPTITPDEPAIRAVFERIELHPEFVLSRRELIRYVLAEPGERSEEVQALLRLNELDRLRELLQKISNACAKDVVPLERTQREAIASLEAALNITKLSPETVVAAANAQREILGLPALAGLESNTSLDDGLASGASAPPMSRVPKAQAQADLTLLSEAFDALKQAPFLQARDTAQATAEELAKEASALTDLSREAILKSALDVFDGEQCPVCETTWEPDAFRGVVATRLAQFSEVSAKRKLLESQVKPVIDALSSLESALKTVRQYGPLLPKPIAVEPLQKLEDEIRARCKTLGEVLPLEAFLDALKSAHAVPDVSETIAALQTSIAAIPEPTKQDAARTFLSIAQERLAILRTASRRLKAGKERAEKALKVFTLYGDITTKALEGIFKEVEKEFVEYYRRINHDDEGNFTAKLAPSLGKLGFEVDFYGKGQFPPGAYHSEGHQDGMGLCLYLALMRYILKENFTFAVLDDVLMSVDAGHRREVCNLLKEKFPDTQLIFTTHDEIWLRHMKSAALIKAGNAVQFRTWSVDLGPLEWDDKDVWAEIEASLNKNDVRGAAALLRHYLEHFAKETCDRLRASVEFRGDAQFMLGDLLPNATAALGDALKRAKAAANSWGQKDVVAAIGVQEAAFVAAKTATGYEQWQVNTAVHFNEWANLQKQDFAPVVAAFKQFIHVFGCAACAGMLSVIPERGQKEGLRCGCGSVNLNLLGKP